MPTTAHDGADRQLPGRRHGAGQQVRQRQQRATKQRGGRRDNAVIVGAEQQPRQVGCDQADEADGARTYHGDRGEYRGNAVHQPAPYRHIQSDTAGPQFARCQHIQGPRQQHRSGQRGRGNAHAQQRMVVPGQITGQPEHHAAHPALLGTGQHQSDQRAADTGYRDAGEQYARGTGLAGQ